MSGVFGKIVLIGIGNGEMNGCHFRQGALIDKYLYYFRHAPHEKLFPLAIEQFFVGCHRYILSKAKVG